MARGILVVGAGFAGVCYARALAESGYHVKVIDQRDHIGGNAFDFIDANGVRRHRYGPHLFHTSNAGVVAWLKRFGEWLPYEHRVRAKLSNGKFVPLPINRETINAIFDTDFTDAEQVIAHLTSIAAPIINPKNAGEYLDSKIGKQLTDVFFRTYTKKMWAMELEQMDAMVVRRIPIQYSLDTRYFPRDKFQMLPASGYSEVFRLILAHDNIKIDLNCEFKKSMSKYFAHTFNSMPIDQYFDYSLGELPYRSIRFHHRTDVELVNREWATTNYTDASPRTRGTYWHILPNHLVHDSGHYTYTEEEPCDYRENNFERYYPLKTADKRHEKLYAQYKLLAKSESNLTFIGRCGTYQYLDMDQVINQSLTGARAWIKLHSHM